MGGGGGENCNNYNFCWDTKTTPVFRYSSLALISISFSRQSVGEIWRGITFLPSVKATFTLNCLSWSLSDLCKKVHNIILYYHLQSSVII